MSLEELEKRVKAMEDLEAIKQMHTNYILALSEQDFEAMIECFTDDIQEDGILPGKKHNGKAAFAKMLREMAESQRQEKLWKGGQILVHPIITVNGDTATGSWTWFRLGMTHAFTSKMGKEVMIFEDWEAKYDMEYRKENGQWKMSKLKFTMPWPNKQWPK